MSDERNSNMPGGSERQASGAGGQTNQNRAPLSREEAARRGPFTYAAGWFGYAFDRSRVDKREAEARRNRNM